MKDGFRFLPVSLLWSLTRRDLEARYRGSWLGLLWALLLPVFMLGLFTLVFYDVFQMKWPATQGAGNRFEFALNVFAGLLLHGWVAEVLSRAPRVLLEQPNLVTRAVFPVTLLPTVAVFSAATGAGLALLVLFAGLLLAGVLGPVAFLAPLILFLVMPWILGLAWGLAAVGVYLRDVAQLAAPLATALMFLAPVFYPVEAVPVAWRWLVEWNPLTLPITLMRACLLGGEAPDAGRVGAYFLCSLAVMGLGWALFRRLRPGFSDVL